MAPDDEVLLALFRGDVARWNSWRREHPDRYVTLLGANLFGAHLQGVNFAEVMLRETNLREADLTEANCTRANFRHSILSRANLSRANLSRAVLVDANLRFANLSGANLRGADLTGAILDGTNLGGADLTGADFTDAQLDESRLTVSTQLHDGVAIARRLRGVRPDSSEPAPSNGTVLITTGDLGRDIDPRTFADLTGAVAALVRLSTRVGSELAQRLSDENEPGSVRVAVRMSGDDSPITLRRAHFGSPFLAQLVDATTTTIPWVVVGGTSARVVKLIGGARIAATVKWLALPSERRREQAVAAADAEEALLRRDEAARKREELAIPAIPPDLLRYQLGDVGLDGPELEGFTGALAPLFRRGFTLSTDVRDVDDNGAVD